MKNYNKDEPSMSQYLPTGAFKWISEKNIDKLDLGKYPEDSKKGLIYLKLTLNIKKNSIIVIMMILLLQKNCVFLMMCPQNIVKKLKTKTG